MSAQPQVSVLSRCPICNRGGKALIMERGAVLHLQHKFEGREVPNLRCLNFDDECRHAAEPFGLYTFAWLPVKCRNGRGRWLCWVEQHGDGTFTLGNRAH